MPSSNLPQILLLKGRQDQQVVNRFMADRSISDEVVGFHAQQAVEKLIKAVLAFRGIKYRRTHQLEELVALLNDAGVAYPPELSEAVVLTPFAVEFRYDLLPMCDDAAPPFDRPWAKRCIERIAEWAASIVEKI